ncbi:MAG: hypothetical protein IJW69_04010, partial [Clostridia bacterium]|nr:hypothetical protein [Clostridia bacterium]
MSKLQVGFSKVNITPALGSGIKGYYIERNAKGILDELFIRTLAITCGDRTVLMFSVDVCEVNTPVAERLTATVARATGVSENDIMITATHTHTGPFLAVSSCGGRPEEIDPYVDFVEARFVDGALLALADRKASKMGYIVGYAPERVAYIRRYKMKDGTTFTCPPINDPDIVGPIGELDQRVNVLRFEREGAKGIALVNYGVHADTVNGELLSADWPAYMYDTLDKALGIESIYFPGAQGDVGSTHVFPEGGDMNDTEISFDNEMKSPGMARFVGHALAGTVLQVYDKAYFVDVDSIDMIKRDLFVPANLPTPEDMPLARKYKELHESGRDDLIPFKAMQLTTVVAEALRMCEMEGGPDKIRLPMMALRLG